MYMCQVFICEYRVEQEKWDKRFGLDNKEHIMQQTS